MGNEEFNVLARAEQLNTAGHTKEERTGTEKSETRREQITERDF